jgi:dTDP-4-dehydrorhamnose 3,5-epimerase
MPILPGKTDDARAFLRELEGPRKGEFDQSERRIGISKELWYLASLPSGDQLVGYMEANNFGQAVEQFSASQDPFDLWFKKRMADVTGMDLNNIPPGFAHGFCVLSEVGEVEYKCTELYEAADELVIAWNDPQIGIDWPASEPLLSAKDQSAPRLAEVLDRLPAYGSV